MYAWVAGRAANTVNTICTTGIATKIPLKMLCSVRELPRFLRVESRFAYISCHSWV